MKRKIVLLDYNKENIYNILDNFTNIIDSNRVITKYNNKILSNVEISNRYFNFNFSDFVKNILNKIDNYFEPVKYTFRVTKSYQELKIYSHTVKLNDEFYFKTLSILNSTDKTYALQINIGLVHSKTYATYSIPVPNENVSIRNKHFKASLPDVIDYFFDSIQNLNLVIDEQVRYAEKLSNKYISLTDFFNMYKTYNDDKLYSTDLLKLRALLYIMKKDTQLISEFDQSQKYLISDIQYIFNNNKIIDIKISSLSLLKYYMEIFKNYNSSICVRETTKFVNIINLI